MRHDLNDLRSQIRFRILPKKRTLGKQIGLEHQKNNLLYKFFFCFVFLLLKGDRGQEQRHLEEEKGRYWEIRRLEAGQKGFVTGREGWDRKDENQIKWHLRGV